MQQEERSSALGWEHGYHSQKGSWLNIFHIDDWFSCRFFLVAEDRGGVTWNVMTEFSITMFIITCCNIDMHDTCDVRDRCQPMLPKRTKRGLTQLHPLPRMSMNASKRTTNAAFGRTGWWWVMVLSRLLLCVSYKMQGHTVHGQGVWQDLEP